MGTDVHLIAEVRNEAGEWFVLPGPIEPCWFCKGAGVITLAGHESYNQDWLAKNLDKPCMQCTREFWEDEDDEGNPVKTPERSYVTPGKTRDNWYSSRNYSVFAYMAGVRNGAGFAGIDTGDPVVPIAEPRGFPEDLSDEGVSWFNRYGGDHTESWLNLDEILSYNWSTQQVHRGVVDEAQYKTFKEKGRPENWSGDISGGGIRKVSNMEMDAVITGRVCGFRHCANPDHMIREADVSYVTQVQWTTLASAHCQHFIDRMEMLKAEVGDRECRIVFNFDS